MIIMESFVKEDEHCPCPKSVWHSLYIHIILTFRKHGALIKTSLSGPSFNLWALRGRLAYSFMRKGVQTTQLTGKPFFFPLVNKSK